MRHARRWRAGLGVLLAGSVSLSGCTHNHYYGASEPACGPTVIGSIAADGPEYGAVCEVPNQVVSGGSVVARRQPGATSSPPPRPLEWSSASRAEVPPRLAAIGPRGRPARPASKAARSTTRRHALRDRRGGRIETSWHDAARGSTPAVW
ncbi:MAG: hypothetical protein WKF75_11995 [Singulisphaera sp.]